MKTNNIAYWIVGIILLAGVGAFVWMGSGGDGTSNTATYSASALSVVEGDFDFGTVVMGNGVVTHNFEVKNDGAETVVVKKVYTSCGCTTAFIIDKTGNRHGEFGMPGHGMQESVSIDVDPGETITVEAIFDPASHGPSGVGLAQRIIYLESNSQSSPKLELTIQSTVIR